MKFRKKAIVVEAMQFDGINGNEICKWAHQKLFPGTQAIIVTDIINGSLSVRTLEGWVYGIVSGNWIIRGTKEEFYLCKPDIFEATYEKIEGVANKVSDCKQEENAKLEKIQIQNTESPKLCLFCQANQHHETKCCQTIMRVWVQLVRFIGNRNQYKSVQETFDKVEDILQEIGR